MAYSELIRALMEIFARHSLYAYEAGDQPGISHDPRRTSDRDHGKAVVESDM